MKLDPQTKKSLTDHIKTHVALYPATKAKLVEACNNMSDFNDVVKQWFSRTVPEGTYKNAAEVIRALGL